MSRRRLASSGIRSVLWGLLGAASVSGIAVAEPLSFDVAEAWLAHDQQTNEPTVTFALTPDSSLRFMEFTRPDAGRPIQMQVDAKVLARPLIVAFPNGVLISGHFGEEEARDLVARFSAGTKIEIEAVAN